MRIVVTLIVMIFCFLLGVFMVQNTHHVEIFYFWNRMDAPVYVVVVATVLTGLFFSVFIQALERIESGREKKRLRRETDELRRELDRLRRGTADP